MLRFGVLGPVAVWTAAGEPVRVPERKVRALLADLLVHARQPVAASRLIDDVWGEQLPENPTNTLQIRVAQLRRALEGAQPGGRELVVRQPPGYLLRVEPEVVDADRFQALVAQARTAGDPRTTAGLLADALALWRGPAYADFDQEPFARAAIDRLAQDRLAALEDHAYARLALGEHTALVGELTGLVAQHPLRERLRAAYMRALYRSGRPSEALDTYRDLRDQLADQLGLDPGPELAALQQAILRQDPLLSPTPAPARPRTNLPAPLTSLIGRAEAVVQVQARLAANRLVTLTGPGGVGKTRLAVAVAGQLSGRYDDGVWLVELATIDHRPGSAGAGVAAGLVRLIATALRLEDQALAPGDPDSAGDPDDPDALDTLVERLAAVLRGRRSLLVLDNCEHLLEPVARLTELLLRAAPGLRVLATSREPLGIPGELVWDVPPLALPDPAAVNPAVLAAASAVQLFVARTAAAVPGFALDPENARAVAGICRRLDGLPLALELAATRIRGLGVHEVAARLDDRFRLLSAGLRGAPARQRTLQAVIAWSWDLLSEPERAVLRRLALHADSWTLPAAEEICAGAGVAGADVPELLARLVDRSLVVRVEAPAGVRYRMLESVGAYCRERLHASGEFEPVQRRHLAYYAGLSTQTEPSLYGHGPLFKYLRQVHDRSSAPPGRRPSRPGVHTVHSRDGTAIAFERSGAAAPLVLVGGALNDRSSFAPLVEWLAPRFTVITYDRRGRGGSGDTPPQRVGLGSQASPNSVVREIEDLRAVVGGAAPAYAVGFSSGAVLAVEAALAGVGFAGLALVEPPFILDDTRPRMPADFADRIDRLVAAGRRGDAVELFLTEAVEMPPEVVAPMRSAPTWPALAAMAHTIGYDLAVMGDFRLPDRWASLAVPTLVLTGTESATWREHAARAVAEILPYGRHRTLDGRSHEAPPEVLGPVLTGFFTAG